MTKQNQPVTGPSHLTGSRAGSFWAYAIRPILVAIFLISVLNTKAGSPQIVIIKADDFRGPNQAWENFLKVSRSAGVKVAIGVIAESLQTNVPAKVWMKTQAAQGDVEFWNHGWDHKQWKENGKTVSEFGGSGLEHQREHLLKAQGILREALGQDVIAFGTPYNAFDADTATVIAETPELRLFFTHNLSAAKIHSNAQLQILDIISESDGTAKPNAAKFETMWQKRPANGGPVSLQFHPPYFDAAHLSEYQKIVDFLKTQGCSIELPSQLIAHKTP